MEWAMWFFAADAWLLYKLANGEFLVPMFLAIGSAMLNTAISIAIFVLLTYLVKKILERLDGYQFFKTINYQVRAALVRKQEAGQRMIGYLERWRHYKYFIILAINVIPFVPWITGGTILYAVVVRDLKALCFALAGLAMKSVIIAGVASLGYLLSRIGS